MTRERWIRIALGYLALQNLQIGLWALFSPKSFYDGFPGLGRGWIAVDGPYNEHLVRDVGALELALMAVFVIAVVNMERTSIRTACVAALVWGVPHFIYHLLNTDGLTVGDQVGLLGGLALYAIIPVAVLVLSEGRSDDHSTNTAKQVSEAI